MDGFSSPSNPSFSDGSSFGGSVLAGSSAGSGSGGAAAWLAACGDSMFLSSRDGAGLASFSSEWCEDLGDDEDEDAEEDEEEGDGDGDGGAAEESF